MVAILAKLHHFRGDSLFTTWARRFAQHEAPAKIRRRLGRGREVPMDFEIEQRRMWTAHAESPHERCVARDAARTLTQLIAEELTAHQREVLIAVAIHGVGPRISQAVSIPPRELSTRPSMMPAASSKPAARW